MIFICSKKETISEEFGWMPYLQKITPCLLKKYKVRIFGKVYTEWSDELKNELEKDEVYDRLLYRL